MYINGNHGKLLSIVLALLVLAITGFVSGCQQSTHPLAFTPPPTEVTIQKSEAPSPSTPVPAEQPTVPAPYDASVKLIAVGDIMMHSPQIPAGYDAATGVYSFDNYFTSVKSILSQGDWVMANLETTLAGKDLKYSGYPMFNSPAELADALKNSGFNIITNANNHSLDRGETGVLRTIDELNARGFIIKGTAKSEAEAQKLVTVSKNGITMAILAYTYGTNGIPVPDGKSYLVSLIDEAKMIKDIKAAKESGVDLVTIALHFGYEYHRMPNDDQKQLAKDLIKAGADIILGSHPHVVQPYEVIDVQDETGHFRKGIVIYSLGNFISNQTGGYTDYGVIFELTINKHFPDGAITFKNIETITTWVHQYYTDKKRNYHIVPIEEALAARNEPKLTAADYNKLAKSLQEMQRNVTSMSSNIRIPVVTR